MLKFLIALFVVLLVLKLSQIVFLAWWIVFLPLVMIPILLLIIAFIAFLGACVIALMSRR